MHFKFILSGLLCFSIIACSNTSPLSQRSKDIRACNAISYGNDNIDIQAMDGVYQTCINDKKKIRKQQKKDAEKLAIFEFFVDLFWPSEH